MIGVMIRTEPDGAGAENLPGPEARLPAGFHPGWHGMEEGRAE